MTTSHLKEKVIFCIASHSYSLEFLFIVRFCFADLFNRDIFLAKWTRCMIFEPIFYAILVKVMLDITWKRHNALFRLELAQANATFVLVCEALGAPFDLEHFI